MTDKVTSIDNQKTQPAAMESSLPASSCVSVSPVGADDSDGADVGGRSTPQPPISINLLHYILNQKKMELTRNPEVAQWLRKSQEHHRTAKTKHSHRFTCLHTADSDSGPAATATAAAATGSALRRRFRSLSADTAEDRNLFPVGIDGSDPLLPPPAKAARTDKSLEPGMSTSDCGYKSPGPGKTAITHGYKSPGRSITTNACEGLSHRSTQSTSSSGDSDTTQLKSTQGTDPVDRAGSHPVTDLVLLSDPAGGPWSWSEDGSAFTTVTRSNATL